MKTPLAVRAGKHTDFAPTIPRNLPSPAPFFGGTIFQVPPATPYVTIAIAGFYFSWVFRKQQGQDQ